MVAGRLQSMSARSDAQNTFSPERGDQVPRGHRGEQTARRPALGREGAVVHWPSLNTSTEERSPEAYPDPPATTSADPLLTAEETLVSPS